MTATTSKKNFFQPVMLKMKVKTRNKMYKYVEM